MGTVEDEYLRELRDSRKKSFSGDIFERMDYRSQPKHATIIEKIKTPDGKNIYKQESRVTVNPYTLEQKHETTKVTGKCSCGFPITGEMMVSDLIQPCTICGESTCQRCRAITDREYIKPEVREQSVCKKCWNNLADKMLIRCPSCGLPLKDCCDIEICVYCGKKICKSCGIPQQAAAMECSHCFLRNHHRSEAEIRADEMIGNIANSWI